ncbi:hypothetical protein H4R34_000865 [Dimargaris verticillata]|uniref:WW domain-containing protein n=1 Tax=Dimargaris verticillata TaxID=2761393 RepID=A0A9W8EBG6_9FUNG|nr:hypothetical protein H4R34_000865 [Dimargaris verticillata]
MSTQASSSWTEHRAPDGRTYYYNPTTKQSVWERPPSQESPPLPAGPSESDKAKKATKIPGTVWKLVTTTQGREYYYNTTTKASVWQVPDSIAEDVARFKNSRQSPPLALAPSGPPVSAELEPTSGTEMTEADIDFQLAMMDEGMATPTESRAVLMAVESTDATAREVPTPQPTLTDDQRAERYKSLLDEFNVSPFALWDQMEPKLAQDSRFSLVQPAKRRKELFDDYCRNKAAQRRATAKPAVTTDPTDAFNQLLRERVDRTMTWIQFKVRAQRDKRFGLVKPAKEREKLFNRHVQTFSDRSDQDLRRSRDAQDIQRQREEASLRRRAREVQRERSLHLRRADQERDRMERDEAIRSFEAWLVDAVRDHTATWTDTKALLKRDPRWDRCRALDLDTQERLFRTRQDQLLRCRLDAFNRLLDQTVTLDNTPWPEVFSRIQAHPDCQRLRMSPEELAELYERHRKTKQADAHRDLAQLIRESWFAQFQLRQALANEGVRQALADRKTADIVASTLAEEEGLAVDQMGPDLYSQSGASSVKDLLTNLRELHQVLKHDSRYLVFRNLPAERDEVIRETLVDMMESVRQQSLYAPPEK